MSTNTLIAFPANELRLTIPANNVYTDVAFNNMWGKASISATKLVSLHDTDKVIIPKGLYLGIYDKLGQQWYFLSLDKIERQIPGSDPMSPTSYGVIDRDGQLVWIAMRLTRYLKDIDRPSGLYYENSNTLEMGVPCYDTYVLEALEDYEVEKDSYFKINHRVNYPVSEVFKLYMENWTKKYSAIPEEEQDQEWKMTPDQASWLKPWLALVFTEVNKTYNLKAEGLKIHYSFLGDHFDDEQAEEVFSAIDAILQAWANGHHRHDIPDEPSFYKGSIDGTVFTIEFQFK